MSSNKKKLAMERLSPIPTSNRDHILSEVQCTLDSPAVASPHKRRRDTYAIESTSSPEFGILPVAGPSSSLQKHRRSRNPTRGNISSKTTPLSGLIHRKPVTLASAKELTFSDPGCSSSTNDIPPLSDKPLVTISEDVPVIDESSPQKPVYSSRHAEIISASKVFPLKYLPSCSTAMPLGSIINKKTSTVHRSLNDSILILQEGEEFSDDEGIDSTSLMNPLKCDDDIVSIESFESPRKDRMLSREPKNSRGIFKKFHQNSLRNRDNNRYRLNIEKTVVSCEEMSGTERKNRKRALDFNSSKFISLIAPAVHSPEPIHHANVVGSHLMERESSQLKKDCDDRLSPILDLHLPLPLQADCHYRQSPILSLRHDDCGPNILEPTSPSLLEYRDGRLSPVLPVLKPSCNETRSSVVEVLEPRSPVLVEDRDDRLSPILHQKLPCHSGGLTVLEPMPLVVENRLSPVLNVTPMLEVKDDRLCVVPEMSRSHDVEHDQQSPALKVMSTGAVDDENESDIDSVIESTPIRSKNRKCDLAGFTASSSFRIENYSPSRTGIKLDGADCGSEIPKIEDFTENASESKNSKECNLNFVVVSHDTSSDDSITHTIGPLPEESHDVIFPTIDDCHSPDLELNYTLRPIRSFESPAKPFKPFSEAVNIDAFGSPDSDASFGLGEHTEQNVASDDVIEGPSTQEFVEESEQVRPTKRRKKGSMLERVKGVIAKGNASNTLFDYEMKCGLRPNKGKLVSAPLVVVKNPCEPPSFIVCKPLKHCKNSLHIERVCSFVIVHTNKLPPGTCEGSVILLHFPINILYHSELLIPCVLAGTQIVSHELEPHIDFKTIDISCLKQIDDLSQPYCEPITLFRAFSSNVTRSLSQAALCQNLVEESNLYLTVLHLTRFYELGVLKKIFLLCCDEESQYCWVMFNSEQNINRAAALETLGVLSDRSHVQTKGFSVVDILWLDKKTKNLIKYCLADLPVGDIIFSVCPNESKWVISSSEGVCPARKTPSVIADIIIQNTFGSRHLLEVHGIDGESEIILRDSRGQTICYVRGENSSVTLDQRVPFFLDGLYFYDGKLFSDEHTRVVSSQAQDG